MKPSLMKKKCHDNNDANLPLFLILHFDVAISCVVRIRETKLPSLNALFDCFVELKDVNTAFAASTGYQIKSGMEHNRFDFCLAVASLELLHAVTTICAKQLDDVTSVTG